MKTIGLCLLLAALLCLAPPSPALAAEPLPELLLKLDRFQSAADIAALDALPRPSAPGARGSQVQILQKALAALSYLREEAVTGVYTPDTARAVLAFQADAGLRQSGLADYETLAFLFLEPETVPGRTQLPRWYDEGMDLIPWGASFTIKDVRSGITFEAFRMMGESHLDAEPQTSEDTRKMKEAYGGVWSWDRRPILINYRGNIYAASMNGKPHGYLVRPEHGMGGHFCIHFAWARGDASQRVDTDHLQAAYEAYETAWEDPATGE